MGDVILINIQIQLEEIQNHLYIVKHTNIGILEVGKGVAIKYSYLHQLLCDHRLSKIISCYSFLLGKTMPWKSIVTPTSKDERLSTKKHI